MWGTSDPAGLGTVPTHCKKKKKGLEIDIGSETQSPPNQGGAAKAGPAFCLLKQSALQENKTLNGWLSTPAALSSTVICTRRSVVSNKCIPSDNVP